MNAQKCEISKEAIFVNNNLKKDGGDEKVYSLNEAIELAGNGFYNISLTVTLGFTLLMMCLDLFSFSIVIAMAGCDLQLSLSQKSLLVSIPFMGPVIMAYIWGYICDTRGRRRSLLIAMSVSFIFSTLCAFAPNWILLGIFKLIGTCFVSCAQSGSSTLLGESCPEKVKGTYLIIMNSTVHLGSSVYFAVGHFIGNMSFSYDLGYINFVPWRLMVLVFALPLGLSAVAVYFFYESPKFLLNADREEEALEVLRSIHRRNGGKDEFKVQKVVLHEEGNLNSKNMPLLKSMWVQTTPLFKPPLIWNTLLLYFLIFIIYSTNSGLYVWLPFIAKAFSTDVDTGGGLCSYITMTANSSSETSSCVATVDTPIIIATASYGIIVSSFNVLLSRLAAHKKALMIALFTFTASCCLATMLPFAAANYFYFGIFPTSICMGPLSVYYVELYPTSFRGMAGCLGVMVARLSSVIGINLIGPLLMAYCNTTFSGVAAFLFCGALMSLLLPTDKLKNKM